MTPLHRSIIDTIEQKVEARAMELLAEFDLLKDGWSFSFTNHKRAIGHCDYRTKIIGYSRVFLNSPWSTIEDTLRHEIAHALCPDDGHGPSWKMKALAVGAVPKSCAEKGTTVSSAQFNYVMRCPECGRKWERYRMRRRNFGSKCPDCGIEVKIFRYRK